MEGWIQLHRKLLVSDTFQNEKLLKVFIYCLLKASHKDHSQRVGLKTVELKEGQFVYGRNKASQELNMNPSTVRNYIDALVTDKMLDIKTTNKFSVISVVNWELYQSNGKEKDSKEDNKRTTKGQQKDTNNNGNNVKNEIYTIFNRWNEQKIIQHKKMNKQMESHINARLEEYDEETLIKAIDNFGEIVKGDGYYWSHKWTLQDFMKPNNVVRFIDEADPFKAFAKNQKQQPKKDDWLKELDDE